MVCAEAQGSTFVLLWVFFISDPDFIDSFGVVSRCIAVLLLSPLWFIHKCFFLVCVCG